MQYILSEEEYNAFVLNKTHKDYLVNAEINKAFTEFCDHVDKIMITYAKNVTYNNQFHNIELLNLSNDHHTAVKLLREKLRLTTNAP